MNNDDYAKAIEDVRASLREFPEGACDVEIAREVTRIASQTYDEGFTDGRVGETGACGGDALIWRILVKQEEEGV